MITDIKDMDEEERLWLNLLSTYFNIHYNKSVKYRQIHKHLIPLFPRCDIELWCLITNTARMLKHRANGLRIPKRYHAYKGNKQRIQYSKMLIVLDVLEAEGYFHFYRGGLMNMKEGDEQISIYVPTNKMLVLWKDIDVSGEKDDLVGVQIRDRLLKENISTKGHTGVADMQQFVSKYNALLADTDIRVTSSPVPVQQYSRIFSDNTSRGGRYYNSAGGVQTMPSGMRKHITINGEPTVELDFKALHPNILYEYTEQELGVLIDMDDPYDIDCSDIVTTDWSIVKEGNNPLRSLLKQIILRSLNARNLTATIPAVTNNWYEEQKKGADSLYYGLTFLNDDDKFPAKALCMRVAEHHVAIKDSFFSDVGLLLQRVDSDIMTVVLQEFTDIGVCALSEHDSVIVPITYADIAEESMYKAYKQIVGSANHCKIERK